MRHYVLREVRDEVEEKVYITVQQDRLEILPFTRQVQEVVCITVHDGRQERVWTPVKKKSPPPPSSKDGPAKKPNFKSERLTVSCEVNWHIDK